VSHEDLAYNHEPFKDEPFGHSLEPLPHANREDFLGPIFCGRGLGGEKFSLPLRI